MHMPSTNIEKTVERTRIQQLQKSVHEHRQRLRSTLLELLSLTFLDLQNVLSPACSHEFVSFDPSVYIDKLHEIHSRNQFLSASLHKKLDRNGIGPSEGLILRYFQSAVPTSLAAIDHQSSTTTAPRPSSMQERRIEQDLIAYWNVCQERLRRQVRSVETEYETFKNEIVSMSELLQQKEAYIRDLAKETQNIQLTVQNKHSELDDCRARYERLTLELLDLQNEFNAVSSFSQFEENDGIKRVLAKLISENGELTNGMNIRNKELKLLDLRLRGVETDFESRRRLKDLPSVLDQTFSDYSQDFNVLCHSLYFKWKSCQTMVALKEAVDFMPSITTVDKALQFFSLVVCKLCQCHVGRIWMLGDVKKDVYSPKSSAWTKVEVPGVKVQTVAVPSVDSNSIDPKSSSENVSDEVSPEHLEKLLNSVSGVAMKQIDISIDAASAGFVAECFRKMLCDGGSSESLPVINVPDAYNETSDRFDRSADIAGGYRTESVLVVGIRAVGGSSFSSRTLLGVCECINSTSSKSSRFANECVDVLRILGQATIKLIATIKQREQEQYLASQQWEWMDTVAKLVGPVSVHSPYGFLSSLKNCMQKIFCAQDSGIVLLHKDCTATKVVSDGAQGYLRLADVVETHSMSSPLRACLDAGQRQAVCITHRNRRDDYVLGKLDLDSLKTVLRDDRQGVVSVHFWPLGDDSSVHAVLQWWSTRSEDVLSVNLMSQIQTFASFYVDRFWPWKFRMNRLAKRVGSRCENSSIAVHESSSVRTGKQLWSLLKRLWIKHKTRKARGKVPRVSQIRGFSRRSSSFDVDANSGSDLTSVFAERMQKERQRRVEISSAAKITITPNSISELITATVEAGQQFTKHKFQLGLILNDKDDGELNEEESNELDEHLS